MSARFPNFSPFDTINVTYPTSSSEVYTYVYDSTSIGTVTVTYTDSTKESILSVVYSN